MHFEHVAGDVALDFVATVAERTTTHTERLQSPRDLGEWLHGAQILSAPPRCTAEDLRAARALREALYAFVVQLTSGASAPADDLALINAVAARPDITLSVDRGGRLTRAGRPQTALAHIARAGLELAAEDPATIRWCAATDCTRPFVDRSHAQRRRWCGMSTCGDKVKAAAYRARRAARLT